MIFCVFFASTTLVGKSVHVTMHCPQRCECSGVSIECSNRALLEAPSDLPPEVERL